MKPDGIFIARCGCGSHSHSVQLHHYDDGDTWIGLMPSRLDLWSRIKWCLKYIWNPCRVDLYLSDTMLGIEETKRLKEWVIETL